MLDAKLEGSLGDIDYAEVTDETLEELVSEALLIVKDKVAAEIHNVSYETFENLSVDQQATIGEVTSSVPWNVVLEYRDHPYMRPGALKARKPIRDLVKRKFGPEWRASIRKRRRRKARTK